MANYGEQSFRNMASRIDTAEAGFIETLMRCGGIPRADAIKVFGFYRKAKIVKNDYAMSRISVKHGAFLDKATIKRAVSA